MRGITAITLSLLFAGCAARKPGKGPKAAQAMPEPERAAVLLWDYAPGYLDVAEQAIDLSKPFWNPIAGPYDLIDNGVTLSYSVPVSMKRSKSFFRIRRVIGVPWVHTPKIETKIETRK